MDPVETANQSRMDESGRAMLERALADPRQQFGSFFLSRFLGLRISYTADACIVEFEAVPPLFNPQGSLHGGVLATAIDVSMGHLLNRVTGPGVTLEVKVQYLAPVSGGTVRCEGSFLHQGKKLSFMQSHARNAQGELIAYATATWKHLHP